MTTSAHRNDAAAGDPYQQQIDAVRDGGAGPLEAELGDQAYVLAALAVDPGRVFDTSEHSLHDLAQLVGRIHDTRSALEALEARAIVAVAETATSEHRARALEEAAQEDDAVDWEAVDKQAHRIAAREVSMITRRSPSKAGQTLTSCRRLVHSMPGMLGALADGKVTGDSAHATARTTAPLSPQQRRTVDELLAQRLPDLDGAGPRRFRDEVAGIIHELDPDGAEKRHEHARTERHVTVREGEHGMATLSAHLPALDAMKAHKRLSLEAERLRAEGDRRGHQAIMADALVDTILGREGGMEPVTLDIGVMITERSLIAPEAGDIAHIEGYGPVPGAAIRAELRDGLREPGDGEADSLGPDGPALRAVLRRMYTHPASGELVAIESRARAFPAALARFIRMRDIRCRGPFCDAPIRQIDHIAPHTAGGHTCLDNGQGACILCNDKEAQADSVERDGTDGHRVTWTSRTGTVRTTRPAPLTPPTRRRRAGRRRGCCDPPEP